MSRYALIMIDGILQDGSLQNTEPDSGPVRTTHYLDDSMHKTAGTSDSETHQQQEQL